MLGVCEELLSPTRAPSTPNSSYRQPLDFWGQKEEARGGPLYPQAWQIKDELGVWALWGRPLSRYHHQGPHIWGGQVL